ncbi:MAG: hypothetical protein ACRC57_09560 [Sarcina sp.]
MNCKEILLTSKNHMKGFKGSLAIKYLPFLIIIFLFGFIGNTYLPFISLITTLFIFPFIHCFFSKEILNIFIQKKSSNFKDCIPSKKLYIHSVGITLILDVFIGLIINILFIILSIFLFDSLPKLFNLSSQINNPSIIELLEGSMSFGSIINDTSLITLLFSLLVLLIIYLYLVFFVSNIIPLFIFTLLKYETSFSKAFNLSLKIFYKNIWFYLKISSYFLILNILSLLTFNLAQLYIYPKILSIQYSAFCEALKDSKLSHLTKNF